MNAGEWWYEFMSYVVRTLALEAGTKTFEEIERFLEELGYYDARNLEHIKEELYDIADWL